jgi:hypothetical protein
MPLLDLATTVLWFGGPLMLSLLLFQGWRRRVWHVCPAFFVYMAVHIARFAILFATRRYDKVYFTAYWIGELIDVGLVVGILNCLYAQLFSGFEGLRALQNALFRWSAAVCILIAVIVAASVPGSDSSPLLQGLYAFDLCAAVLKAGLIIFVMVLSSALALRWNHYAFAVLVGMGVYNSIELATVAVRLHMGPTASVPYSLIKQAAYTCALLVWIGYFFGKERSGMAVASIPQNELAFWNQALLELIGR